MSSAGSGYPRIPYKSSIWRAYELIPQIYLRETHLSIVRDIMARSLAGVSAGYYGSQHQDGIHEPEEIQP